MLVHAFLYMYSVAGDSEKTVRYTEFLCKTFLAKSRTHSTFSNMSEAHTGFPNA